MDGPGSNLTGISAIFNKSKIKSNIDIESIENDLKNNTDFQKVKMLDKSDYDLPTLEEQHQQSESSELSSSSDQSEWDDQWNKQDDQPDTVEDSATPEQDSTVYPEQQDADHDPNMEEDFDPVRNFYHNQQAEQQQFENGPYSDNPTRAFTENPVHFDPLAPDTKDIRIKSNYKKIPDHRVSHIKKPVLPPRHKPREPDMYEQVFEDYDEQNLYEREQMYDQKEKMLDDIDDLRLELEDEDIKLDNIPLVNTDSSYYEIERVYKLLKRKWERTRCEGLSQEIFMASARAVEVAFDGEKSYFGFQPDMTGWHRTVRTKLRRMRYEQSQLVSSFIQAYNVGPFARMALELVPSAFLYSLSRREQHGIQQYNPYQTVDSGEALNDLRDM